MNHLCLIFFLFLFTASASAQVFNFMDVPVFKNGQQLANPWAGGMNAPQWARFDINNDGVEDLYAFDRNGGVHLSFINMDNSPGAVYYKYSREWLKHFPEVRSFVLMRDYNNDGLVDLFANSFDEFQTGIKVFKASLENGLLKYDRVLFPEYLHDIIPVTENGVIVDKLNIWLHVDYPAIEDMDNDGDLDILAMSQSGDKIYLYNNLSQENGFGADSLIFKLADDCWGRIGLQPDTLSLSLSLDPGMCVFFNNPEIINEKSNPHGGTSLSFFDADDDGDQDLLYGDLISQNIIFGKNNGDNMDAWISEQDTLFPNYDLPINIPFFSSTFLIDYNNDGAKDLIASPNQIWTTPDIETAWNYQNIGTTESPVFEFESTDFLAGGMLDFGTGANPVFVDVNADGLQDIVVGNRNEWAEGIGSATLYLLLNSGMASAPAYTLADEDWLGLGQFFPSLSAMYPAFGDLDGDGDSDLLIGDFNGNLHYAENVAGAGNPMVFSDFVFNWKNIDVGNFSTPFIHDMNKDGLPDLLIGELKGTVNYLPNTGVAASPDFHPVLEEFPNNNYFGKINTQPPGGTVGYSQPTVLDFGDKAYLFTGSYRGKLKQYHIDYDSLEAGSFELLDDYFGEIREGDITRVCFKNINDDEFIDAIIGNDRGGLSLFQTPITEEGVVSDKFVLHTPFDYRISPNPTSGFLKIENNSFFDLEIYNSIGQYIYSQKNINRYAEINLDDLANGIYFIRLKIDGKNAVEKIILSK